jgi:hypothetical protein
MLKNLTVSVRMRGGSAPSSAASAVQSGNDLSAKMPSKIAA